MESARSNFNVDISSSTGIVNINIGISFRRLLFYVIGFNAILCTGFMVFTYFQVPNYNKIKQKKWSISEEKDQKRLEDAIARARLPKSRDDTQNGFVVMTTTNKAFIGLTDNWLQSISRLGLDYNITLIAEDSMSYYHFKKMGQKRDNVFVVNGKYYKMKGVLEKEINHYQQLIRRRTVYVRETLYSGYDVLLVDGDTVWLKDPLQIVWNSYDDYDTWIAQGNDVGVPCPCFMYLKSVPTVMNLVHQWTNRLTYKPRNRRVETDQNALQVVLGDTQQPGPMHVRVMTLRKDNFPTGIELFNRVWYKLHFDDVVVAHANHQGRAEAKIAKFKEFNLWLLDEKPLKAPREGKKNIVLIKERIAETVKGLSLQQDKV